MNTINHTQFLLFTDGRTGCQYKNTINGVESNPVSGAFLLWSEAYTAKVKQVKQQRIIFEVNLKHITIEREVTDANLLHYFIPLL